jgi:hypothetical protein
MSDELLVGDRVIYQDAITGETKFGLITSVHGGDAIIRVITEAEAGKDPKRLPRSRIGCAYDCDKDGTPICRLHRQPLHELGIHGSLNPPGVGHLTAWICPISHKQVLRAGGM